jgi:hypothetical protein
MSEPIESSMTRLTAISVRHPIGKLPALQGRSSASVMAAANRQPVNNQEKQGVCSKTPRFHL